MYNLEKEVSRNIIVVTIVNHNNRRDTEQNVSKS